VCQGCQKGREEWGIFLYGISVGYRHDFNGLNDLNAVRAYELGSMKLFTTFVGKVLPLSGRRIHTFTAKTPRTQRALGHRLTQIYTDLTAHPDNRGTRDAENEEEAIA
jgi:hypothetical protein